MSNRADCFVEADNYTLLQQAPMTAEQYMRHGAERIDATFGDGYAKKHPELVAAFMQTAAIDLGTSIIARAIDNMKEVNTDAIARAIDDLGAGELIAQAISALGVEIGNAISPPHYNPRQNPDENLNDLQCA